MMFLRPLTSPQKENDPMKGRFLLLEGFYLVKR
jgi:hypothetical protein